MLLGAPLGAGTPHWCVRSIIGHDSPVLQHGELFSGAAGAMRLMRIVRRQAPLVKPARTRCIAASSQHYERPMSTPPDWPGPNTTPPLHSQTKAFGAIGTPFAYGPFSTFAPLKSPASNAAPYVPDPIHCEGSRFVPISLFLAQIYGCERWQMSQEEPSVP